MVAWHYIDPIRGVFHFYLRTNVCWENSWGAQGLGRQVPLQKRFLWYAWYPALGIWSINHPSILQFLQNLEMPSVVSSDLNTSCTCSTVHCLFLNLKSRGSRWNMTSIDAIRQVFMYYLDHTPPRLDRYWPCIDRLASAASVNNHLLS